MSDQALEKSNIKNATFIIHYDFPKHKTEFGSRLMCMLDNIHENVRDSIFLFNLTL